MKQVKFDRPKLGENHIKRSRLHYIILPFLFVLAAAGQALAQAAPEQHMSPAQFITSTVWYFLIGFAVYWMLVLKPSQAKQESKREFLENLKTNDEVLTSGGIFGRVVGVKPEFILVEIAPSVRVKVKPDHCSSPKSADIASAPAGKKS